MPNGRLIIIIIIIFFNQPIKYVLFFVNFKVDPKELEFGKELGRGEFGVVRLADWNGQQV